MRLVLVVESPRLARARAPRRALDPRRHDVVPAAGGGPGDLPVGVLLEDGRTLFASELIAFDPVVRPHVEDFPPGFRWTPDEGLVRFRELHIGGEFVASKDEARTAIRDTLVTAVRRLEPEAGRGAPPGGPGGAAGDQGQAA